MFDLEEAVADWRRQMRGAGLKQAARLDELESHLREEFSAQARAGEVPATAFEFAVRQIGSADVLKTEFAKIGGIDELVERLKRACLILIGVNAPNLITTMNTTPKDPEPRWATYLKAGIFITPAVSLWLAAVIFALPKVREVCGAAGLELLKSTEAMIGLTAHGGLACAAFLAPLIALEWRSSRWPRYRRAAAGVAVFLLNTAVLVGISTMIVSATVAADVLLHRGR